MPQPSIRNISTSSLLREVAQGYKLIRSRDKVAQSALVELLRRFPLPRRQEGK